MSNYVTLEEQSQRYTEELRQIFGPEALESCRYAGERMVVVASGIARDEEERREVAELENRPPPKKIKPTGKRMLIL